MLVATPGQTAYTLHNNSGNAIPTTTAPPTKKQQTSVNSVSSSSATTKCLVNNNHPLSNTTAVATPSLNPAGNSIKLHNNFSFHTPSQKNVSNANIKTSKETNQHSLNNSDKSKTTSFISNLKDTVQKATTGISLSRNCNQSTTVAIKTPCTTIANSSNHTSKSTIATSLSSQNITASSANTLNTTPSSSSTNLPLTVARKKFSQSIATQPKLHTIPPTILHRYPEERQHASSTDSLQKEMCHFKPIRTVPTTPWKSGSKSRGSSLRFPKANLATTKNEFILKSNCDVKNRMKKKPQTKPTQHEPDMGDNEDNNDEQENQEYCERFKPKPSTLHLSPNFETPNHQSAFVCLVAQMKLINIQSTKTLTSLSKGGGDNMDLHKTKSARTASRTKDSGNITKNFTTASLSSSLKRSINVPVTEIFVRPKKFKSPESPAKKPDLVNVRDVVATRSNRSTAEGKTPDITEVSKKTAKANELAAKVTKAKSRRKLKGAKSKMINIAQLVKASQAVKEKSQTSPTVDAGHPAAGEEYAKSSGQRFTRKRKITPEFDVRPIMCKSTTVAAITTIGVPPTPSLRSSTKTRQTARLPTITSTQSNLIFKYPETLFSRASQRTEGGFSPPLTRARLKLLLNQQQFNKADASTPVVDVKKRKG